MDMLDRIKAGIRRLYDTHPDVHISVSMTRPRTSITNEPVTIVGVYRHLFHIEEHRSGFHRKYTIPYSEILINQVEILELKAHHE